MKPEQCCDEPRGFVGGVCDHCGGIVQHEFTHLELEQQVRELSFRNYKLERDRDAYKNKLIYYENALIQISKLSYDDCPDFALDSIQSLTHNILND